MVHTDLFKSKQAKGTGREHSERHLLTHTLWRAHLSILKNIAFALGSVGRMAELLDKGGKLFRPGDLIETGTQVTGGADVPYKRICGAKLKVEDHSFVC